MQKKGQVSIFVIVGVILVILVALFFFVRNEYGFFIEPTAFLDEKSKPIEDNLKNCINSGMSNSLDEFGKQGGDFNPSDYKFYEGYNVRYFCLDIANVPECSNRMPNFEDIVNELNVEVSSYVKNCIDEGLVQGGFGYDVEAGELVTSVSSSANSIVVRADYDVEIIKGEIKTSVKPVTLKFDIPLEEIYAVSVDIVNSEARSGKFEQLLYMLNKRGQVIINLDKPYPDKIYKINMKDDDFEFWFAVEGERGV